MTKVQKFRKNIHIWYSFCFTPTT